MSDLAQHHRMIELREQVEQLQSKVGKLSADLAECKGLKQELKRANAAKSRYKCKWRLAMREHELPTDKARRLIRASRLEGFSCSVVKECARIGDQIGMTGPSVQRLWYTKT